MERNRVSQKKYEIDMINGPLMPKLITFFVPLMISSVLQLLFNAVDLVVVGKWAGSQALAAVGATTALIHLFTNLLIGISMGANVVAAGYLGLRDRKGVSEAVHTSITLAVLIGGLVLLLGLLFSRQCLIWMGTPENVLDKSALYMRIYFCGMPCFALYNYGAAILRAAGDTRRPLFYLTIAGILNAFLNMFLVIVFHLDEAGVAIATVFSQTVSCILVLRCLLKTDQSYRLEFRKLHINPSIMKRILIIGIPTGLQSTAISFSNVLLQSSVNSFGSVAMAGYTAANNVFGFMYASVNSITQASMSFTSQNYAVRRFDRIRRLMVDCLFLECVVSMILGIAVHFGGNVILSIYTDSAEVMQYGRQVFRYCALTYFLCGIMDCIPGFMRGMGHSAMPMIFAVLGTVGTRIIWIICFFPSFHSLDFLFLSYPVSWAATIVMQTACLIVFLRKLVRIAADPAGASA